MQQLTFDDIPQTLLNPSVQPPDEQRLEKHFQALYLLFVARHRLGLPVSTLDLMDYAKAQYNARLLELRLALIGLEWCIDRVPELRQNGINYYKLVILSKSTYYAKRKQKLCIYRNRERNFPSPIAGG